jgi:hypothetical protein
MSDYIYSKEFVYDPKNGVLRNMAGQLTWRIRYFFEIHKPTGDEIRNTSFEPAGDDYKAQYECTYRKEISKEEYERGNNAE